MKVWNRAMTPAPDRFTEAAPLLLDALAHVNENSAFSFNAWMSVLGPAGLGVSALCEDFGALSDEMAQRGQEDEVFRTKVAAAAACMAGVPEDSVWNVVGGAGDMSGTPNIVGIQESRFQFHQLAGAVASTVEMVDYIHSLAGTPASVSVSIWGTGPAVRVTFGYESISDMDQRAAAAASDPGFHERQAAFAASVGDPIESSSLVLRRIL
ncbi:MAG: hypothetical protein MK182_06700 [Acidimicrobiales bacterium]|nr:hypothetical protein [Acidimicrobiales bacterium]